MPSIGLGEHRPYVRLCMRACSSCVQPLAACEPREELYQCWSVQKRERTLSRSICIFTTSGQRVCCNAWGRVVSLLTWGLGVENRPRYCGMPASKAHTAGCQTCRVVSLLCLGWLQELVVHDPTN